MFLVSAFQVGEGGVGWRRRYFSSVDFATSMPSLRNSPRMRGEPHRGLAAEILRINSRLSWLIGGLPGVPLPLMRVQWSRNRLRGHTITVAGFTKTRTSRHLDQRRDSQDQKIGSAGRRRGR